MLIMQIVVACCQCYSFVTGSGIVVDQVNCVGVVVDHVNNVGKVAEHDC